MVPGLGKPPFKLCHARHTPSLVTDPNYEAGPNRPLATIRSLSIDVNALQLKLP